MLPNGFKLGFSESGFQFEMGLSDPDTNSDWYAWCHDKRNQELGYVSGDLPENGVAYWDKFHEDHDLASSIGMNAARLGIEWSRIFPKTTRDMKLNAEFSKGRMISAEIGEKELEQLDRMANPAAVNHYRNIFQDWKDRNKFLVINLYHWSIPVWLNDPSRIPYDQEKRALGGSFDREVTMEYLKYAAYIAWKFDDLADMWSTMNEPNMVFQYCSTDQSRKATDQRKRDFAEAHARAYDLIKSISRKPAGVIYANGDLQPLSPSDEDAVKLARYNIRFSFFDYIIRGDSQWLSTMDGGESGIPDIREDMVGKTDWIGVNYYSRDMVRRNGDGWEIVPGYGHATGQRPLSLDGRSVSETGWEIYPEGIYNVVMEYQKRYSIPMMVTENGMADATDKFRPRYLVSHVNQLERAIKDGADLRGYFHWALTDNFEWASGFSKKFGLFGVDLKTKQRQLRPSALVFSRLSENNGVPDDLRWMVEEKI